MNCEEFGIVGLDRDLGTGGRDSSAAREHLRSCPHCAALFESALRSPMETIHITLPDGQVQEVPKGTTPADIAKKISPRLADAALVGLCPDTGHSTYAGIDPVSLLDRHAQRLAYVHFKDIDTGRLAAARAERLSFPQAVARGIFRPLGDGSVDFAAVAARLAAVGYSGWATVEQDRLPDDSSTPVQEARRSLAYLREIGLADSA